MSQERAESLSQNSEFRNAGEYYRWRHASSDHVDYQNCLADVAEDVKSGLMLAQILYYFEGRTQVNRDGCGWLAKSYREWAYECRLTPDQAAWCVRRLKRRGLIRTDNFRFGGSPVVHITIEWENLLSALRVVTAPGYRPEWCLREDRAEKRECLVEEEVDFSTKHVEAQEPQTLIPQELPVCIPQAAGLHIAPSRDVITKTTHTDYTETTTLPVPAEPEGLSEEESEEKAADDARRQTIWTSRKAMGLVVPDDYHLTPLPPPAIKSDTLDNAVTAIAPLLITEDKAKTRKDSVCESGSTLYPQSECLEGPVKKSQSQNSSRRDRLTRQQQGEHRMMLDALVELCGPRPNPAQEAAAAKWLLQNAGGQWTADDCVECLRDTVEHADSRFPVGWWTVAKRMTFWMREKDTKGVICAGDTGNSGIGERESLSFQRPGAVGAAGGRGADCPAQTGGGRGRRTDAQERRIRNTVAPYVNALVEREDARRNLAAIRAARAGAEGVGAELPGDAPGVGGENPGRLRLTGAGH